MTPTREEILAMAKAAEVVGKNNTGSGYTFDRLVALANLAYTAGQRDMQERAAKTADSQSITRQLQGDFNYRTGCYDCAAAIRSLEVP